MTDEQFQLLLFDLLKTGAEMRSLLRFSTHPHHKWREAYLPPGHETKMVGVAAKWDRLFEEFKEQGAKR